MAPSTKTIDAMREALEDEYLARATYQKVIEAFGPVRPFVNIVEAEDRHAKALLALFAKFEIDPPQDTWPEHVTVPATLAEACRAGVEAEIENQSMYERLLKNIDEPEVLAVMQRLQQASQKRHLPAFQRCLERESTGSHQSCEGPRRTRSRQRRS